MQGRSDATWQQAYGESHAPNNIIAWAHNMIGLSRL